MAMTPTRASACGCRPVPVSYTHLANIMISLLRKVIPGKVHLPCYIVIIAGFVTIVQMFM